MDTSSKQTSAKSKVVKILLLIDYSSEFSRKLLRGVVQYSEGHGKWIFYRLPSYYKTLLGNEAVAQWAKEWKADAIIAQWDNEESLIFKELNIPVLLQNYKERSPVFSNLTGNYIGTGVMAARFFAQKRFQNFAFYGNRQLVWSRERALGYREEIERIGGNYLQFETDSLSEAHTYHDYMKLEKWLISLPKPIALFACDDTFALQIAEVCKINNINIPNEVSLLGVDNDELICNLSDPPISSIILDVEKGGYEAGRLIHQLMVNERKKPYNIVIHPLRIENRQSTGKRNITNKYILEVVKYIEENYTLDINIESLTKLVPLSRRNLELKFKQEMGISTYQFVLSCRVENFTNLLITTNRTLLELAFESGFKDYKNISRIFKKFKGCTPIEYRKRFA